MDIEHVDPWGPQQGRYTCSDQGVSAGWSDVYVGTLPCQFIIIDGVPDGDYRVLATTNHKQTVVEDRYTDNSVLVGVRIQGSNATEIALCSPAWASLGRVASWRRVAGGNWAGSSPRRPPWFPGARIASTPSGAAPTTPSGTAGGMAPSGVAGSPWADRSCPR